MGQKFSCFERLTVLRLIGKRRRKRSSGTPTLDSAVYIKSTDQSIINDSSIGNTEGITSGNLVLNPQNELFDRNFQDANNVKEESACLPTPEFLIKDRTIILAPSRRDIFRPSSASYLPPNVLFGGRCLGTPEPLVDDDPEPTSNSAYHHSLPYIPPKSTLSFVDKDFEGEEAHNLSDSPKEQHSSEPPEEQHSHDPPEMQHWPEPPAIPPRKHEVVLNATTVEMDYATSQDPPRRMEFKIPPPIPPRLSEASNLLR